jgi:hypothetical protein
MYMVIAKLKKFATYLYFAGDFTEFGRVVQG